MHKQQNLIVIQGGSAAGKSTLARKLSKDLGIYHLSKDYFKEMMYDKLGIPDTREESYTYGLSASKAVYAAAEVFLDDGNSLIIESVFRKGFAEQEIQQIIGTKNVKLMQLYVFASPEIRMKRFKERIASGERHMGHPDRLGNQGVENFAKDTHDSRRLNIDNTIDIDTDNFTDSDYQNLLESVKIMIGNEEK